MNKKIIAFLGCAILMCLATVKNADMVNTFISSVEALADGGDIGTPDFYLSKSHTERFSESLKDCQQMGLTNIPDDIRYTNLGGYAMVFYYCCDENEKDSQASSCHPYYASSTSPEYSLNRENLCDVWTDGIWSYENQERR